MCPQSILYGLSNNYIPQIHDKNNDNVFCELGEAFKLLIKSNPTIIESLFIPKRCIIYEDKLTSLIKENSDLFISKKIYKTFGEYAKSQIHKMTGLNKAIVNPVYERLTPLDFCYTFMKQGSTRISNRLSYRGLNEKYCGLINIPNMLETYGVYYDLGAHIINEIKNLENYQEILKKEALTKIVTLPDFLKNLIYKKFGDLNYIDFSSIKPIGYRGIINKDNTSNELRLSSIPKFEIPLCNIVYNVNGYTKHCIDYKRYQEWVTHRNPVRYEHNLKQNYDTKNASHLIRLLHTCTEALNGEGVNIDRTGIDAELLLKIRNGNVEYDELKEMVEKDSILMDKAYNNTKLKDTVNISDINQLLIDVRNEYYKKSQV